MDSKLTVPPASTAGLPLRQIMNQQKCLRSFTTVSPGS